MKKISQTLNENETSLNILHLTDIHIGYDFVYDKVKDLAYRISEEFENSIKNIDLVLVSGDIFDGRSHIVNTDDKLISDAHDFFRTLLERINKNQGKQLNFNDFIFLPGNHDLVRDKPDIFSFYRKFLKKIYGNDKKLYSIYDKDHLFSYRIFESQQIVVLGLNSCKIEKQEFVEQKWIKDLKLPVHEEKVIVDAYKKANEDKWYDYGYIELEQFTNAIDELKGKINALENYNIVVSFHHHIHPFPEIYGKTGDISLIKNFEPIIEKLQFLHVRLVLHGHKHLPLIRPVANDKFLKDPNTMLYVVAGGNIGTNSITERYFQLVEVFGKIEKNKIAKIKRYQFRQEMREDPVEISIPPKHIDESARTTQLREIIENEIPQIFKKYITEIYDRDNLSREKNIDKITTYIGDILTTFRTIKEQLIENPYDALYILLFAHYRVNANINNYESENESHIKGEIKTFLSSSCDVDSTLVNDVFSYLDLKDSNQRERIFDKLHSKDFNSVQRRFVALCSITSYFTDFYQVLANYADIHYKRIQHKINIKLEKGMFHREIPSNHIVFGCENDRRSIIVRLTSTNPTSHKIAVLFIKSFEIKLSSYEKDFDEIGLKTYYIVPKVEKTTNTYQLDDYNFEAYIPSLLPLLIGENIYSKKEVFIRELIQNSLDAILLRRNLDKTLNINAEFSSNIEITFEKDKIDDDKQESVNIIKVRDEGTGMSQNLVERYFVHIGRSFYSSEEYRDLLDKNEVSYKPISKFGIGFLTSFLVCREIRVLTSYFNEPNNGLDIYIPNHEGCFFINKDSSLKAGTSVMLYEDPKNQIEFNKIVKYLRDNILDLQVPVVVKSNIPSLKQLDFQIESFQLRRDHYSQRNSHPFFFIPFNNEGLKSGFNNEENLHDPFGIAFKYVPLEDAITDELKYKIVEMNAGIRLVDGSKPARDRFANSCFDVYVNYPPSYISLDVSREKIKDFNEISGKEKFLSNNFTQGIYKSLNTLVMEWIDNKTTMQDIYFADLYRIFEFLHEKDKMDISFQNRNIMFLKSYFADNTMFFYFSNDFKSKNKRKAKEYFIPYPSKTQDNFEAISAVIKDEGISRLLNDDSISSKKFQRFNHQERLFWHESRFNDYSLAFGYLKSEKKRKNENIMNISSSHPLVKYAIENTTDRHRTHIKHHNELLPLDSSSISVIFIRIVNLFATVLYLTNSHKSIGKKNEFTLDLNIIQELKKMSEG